ncbi:hypothetical protein TIFTF001_015107 [Ficus carica]|uniref:Protein kinase domain-containing protein n=1 Tax=Ficus carica TaxID=3494 RepID=A0AA88DIK7_FICCA|nr:hypothetical protein TIFTF001_015107 [Ficus carica]
MLVAKAWVRRWAVPFVIPIDSHSGAGGGGGGGGLRPDQPEPVGEANVTSPPPEIYAFAQCHDDLSACFAAYRTKLPRCVPASPARIFLDGCFLRFDNYNKSKGRGRRGGGDGGFGVRWRRRVRAGAVLEDGGEGGVPAVLRAAGERVRECAPAAEGRAMFAGCFPRHSTQRFFQVSKRREDRDSAGVSMITDGVLSSVAFVLLACVGVYYGFKTVSSRKKEDLRKKISTTLQNSRLNFKYETLDKVSDFFDASRKLGQDEFFNEVNLLSGIEHKNLVKLLGCSIEGPENKKNSVSIPSWQQRFNIIVGTVEGLAHLHGGCGVKIIHRDIKTSNILVGENHNPKLADFRLARSVAIDRTHISTGIAGTLVMILGIACGRKNSAFTLGSSSLSHSIWKLYKENKIAESVDPVLNGNFRAKEASNVLQIGLLCTQASVALRPSMSEVVQMLNDREYEISFPIQPSFLNASLLNSDDSKTVSDGRNTNEVSATYTVNSSTIYESIYEITVTSRPS